VEQTDTKARIIEAAIEEFLEKGYESATIRGICAKACANVAAVNYHFGSKDALRAAALERIMESCYERYPMTEGLDGTRFPEERLRLFIRNLLRLIIPDDPVHARRSKLVWQEMDNPSLAFSSLVERFMRPIKGLLDEIILEIVGRADLETIRLCAGSIAGQCYFHAQNKTVIAQLFPEKTCFPHDVKGLADHVYLFSLAGLEALRGLGAPTTSR